MAWRSEGLSYAEIGRRLGVTGARVAGIARHAAWEDALRWTMEAAGVRGLLSRRTYLLLGRAGLSIDATRTMSDAELLTLRNLGVGALAEIRRAAARSERDAS